jgi:hypothetical protein
MPASSSKLSERKRPNVFVAWSGARSRKVARYLHDDWLKVLIQVARPFISIELDKGFSWSEEIGASLRTCATGIICLTPENQADTWINFEGGAISNSIRSPARVCTLLLGLSQSDVKGPLSRFQHTVATDQEEVWRLTKSINAALDETVEEGPLRCIFDKMWPDFSKVVTEALAESQGPVSAKSQQSDLLSEVLGNTRSILEHLPRPYFPIPGKTREDWRLFLSDYRDQLLGRQESALASVADPSLDSQTKAELEAELAKIDVVLGDVDNEFKYA